MSLPPPVRSRDATIDIVRGLAIFTMVFANLGPLLVEPHSWFFRFYGTFAAPIFVSVAGMMVGYTALKTRDEHDFDYFLMRGLFLIGVGAFIDVFAWGTIPFMTMDVLYLIGTALPLAYLMLRLPLPVSAVLTLLIFLITPFLQRKLGYTPYPTEMDFHGKLTETLPNQTNVLNHWIVDGWFPLFPWLGYAFTAWEAVNSGRRERYLGEEFCKPNCKPTARHRTVLGITNQDHQR